MLGGFLLLQRMSMSASSSKATLYVKCGSYVSIKFSALIIINIWILIVDQIARNIGRVRLAGRLRLGWPAHSYEQCFQIEQYFSLTTISRNSILAYFSVLPNCPIVVQTDIETGATVSQYTNHFKYGYQT